MHALIRKLYILLPAAYLLGAVLVWIEFARMPPDGLANAGLALYTLPVLLAATAVTKREFPFVGGGYREAHAIYFAASVLLIAALLFLLLKLIRSKLTRPQ
jgi:hypothetical protein